jgi:hypothetical protein
MSRVLVVFVLMLMPAAAQNYPHRVSLSFGGMNPIDGWQAEAFDSAPMLSFDYGFRFNRYGQWDAGVDTAFATEEVANIRRNLYIPRIGYSLIVPLWRDRIEAQVGAGGAYIFIKPNIGYEQWMVYLQGKANYALDRDKRFRAGLTTRWYRDPIGSPVQQWLSFSGEVSYSFGR